MKNLKKIKKFLRSPILHIILVFMLTSFLHSRLNSNIMACFLTISVCLKEILIFMLPFLLFSFVAMALSRIPRNGMLFILGLMVLVSISNFLNVLISGIVGFSILSGLHAREIQETTTTLEPFFSVNIPNFIGTTEALLLGICVGLFNSFHQNKYISLIVQFIHDAVMKFMKKFFIPLLPLFICGFLFRLFVEGKMTGFIEQNTPICLMMCCFLVCYLAIWLLISAEFKSARAMEILKNTLPAIVTAFSTMSSAAALPLSLNAAEKNTKDRVLSDAVMPLTMNFHMVGDTILVPIMAMLVMISLNKPLPSVTSFVLFGVFFVLNKFAGGGVPSGTIMVTIPVLKDHFGFDDSMIAFIVAFYGVIDPIATAGNVSANNFFVIIFQKIRSFVANLSK